MDVVDISKEVVALADFYSGINYSNPLRDPRVNTFVQDGRFFLQASPRRAQEGPNLESRGQLRRQKLGPRKRKEGKSRTCKLLTQRLIGLWRKCSRERARAVSA